MRTKALLTSILLGSLSLAGVASADPIIRDHRYQPAVTVQPAVQVRYDYRAPQQPTTYGYQLSANGRWSHGYAYGQDPRVEGIARGEWYTVNPCVEFERVNNVRISLANRAYRSVELQATSGDVEITQIGVQFRDGSHMIIKPNRDLGAHAPNLRIDFGAKGLQGVESINVHGTGTASFRVLGA